MNPPGDTSKPFLLLVWLDLRVNYTRFFFSVYHNTCLAKMSYSSNSDFEGFLPQFVENAERNIAQVDFISISDVDSTDIDYISTDSDSEIDLKNADNLWSENF